MNDSLLLIIVGVAAASVFVLMAGGLIWLWREQKRLKQDFQVLSTQLQRSNDDVAGLCSAAVAVDKRLAANELHLSNVLNNIYIKPQPTSQPLYEEVVQDEEVQDQDQGYELAIEKIRRGANVEELVKSCGLTRDEAVLLVRLHGR